MKFMIVLLNIFFFFIASDQWSQNAKISTFYLNTLPESRTDLALTAQNLHQIRNEYETIFMVHGWNSNGKEGYFTDMQNAYIKRGIPINFIKMDWSPLSFDDYIKTATSGVRTVSKYLGELILELYERGLKLSNLQIIGHSLGSHVAGCAGKYIYNKTREKVARISGLDPAGPFFYLAPMVNITCILSSKDAEMVDTIHTNMGLLGNFRRIGSVNIFVNGGTCQPGCFNPEIFTAMSCSHARAPILYVEAINSNQFVCRSFHRRNEISVYGQNMPFGTTGDYCLDTNHQSPFAVGFKTKCKNFFDAFACL